MDLTLAADDLWGERRWTKKKKNQKKKGGARGGILAVDLRVRFFFFFFFPLLARRLERKTGDFSSFPSLWLSFPCLVEGKEKEERGESRASRPLLFSLSLS